MKNTIIESTCVPLPRENIDTDQIVPARFLKAVTKEKFGENLFRDWRFDENNKPKNDFVLNNPRFKGGILVAGRNFGSGSSREHAAWTLKDYGFDAVVSSFFADIFKNNALINRLLPVEVSDEFLQGLLRTVHKNPKTKVTIDIENQTISYSLSSRASAKRSPKIASLQAPRNDSLEKINIERFPLDPYRKMCFLKEYDDIDYLLCLKSEIEKFEQKRVNDFSI